MERNTVTTAAELLPGDRFYKLKDKNKKVYEKQPADILVYIIVRERGTEFKTDMKKDVQVVFLSHGL